MTRDPSPPPPDPAATAHIDRRAFLGATLAGVAGAAVPRSLIPPPRNAHGQASFRSSSPRRGADVLVVGAGLAGLMAARTLVASGVSVMVLEARGRVGGRTLNHPIGDGKVLEVGGQWIGPLPTDPGVSYPQKRLYQLAVDLGIKTFRTYNKGAYLDYSNGRLIRYHGRIPPDPGAANAGYAIQALDRMAEKVPPDAPWRAVSAIEWDSQTFETWMKSNLVPPAVPPTFTTSALVNLAVESVFAAEPRDVSLLHVLWYIRNAGSLNNLVDTAGGAQDSRFVGGSQLVSIRMAEQLGDRVILRSPVRTIAQASGHVDVSTDRVTVRGDRVIVAIPPTLTRGIRFDPGLATFDWGARDQLAQRTPMGTTIKVMCLYPTPFWRGEGLAGQVTSDAGPVKITFDNSPYPDWRPGVLVGFFEGDAGREWGRKTQAQRRAATIGSLVRYFGPKAGRPIGYIEKVWAAEEFTGGCYGAFFPPGVWTQYGATLRRPLGRLHWAGTETATSWAGYMEGAVESGQRVAAEVMAALGSAAARR